MADRDFKLFRVRQWFTPIFDDVVDAGTRLEVAKNDWLMYEFQRRSGADIPRLTIVEVELIEKVNIVDIHPTDMKPSHAIRFAHGVTLEGIFEEFEEGYIPLYAISRTGKSAGKCSNISNSIRERGSYTFFTSENDLILAKVILGSQCRKVYEFAPVFEKYGVDISQHKAQVTA